MKDVTGSSVPLKTTPLYEWHHGAQANMAAFGGYRMPLWYSQGVTHEHRAVLSGCGLFDTSHMAVLTVEGDDAGALLQRCFTRDLRSCIGREPGPLVTGRCVYGLFLKDDGTVLDDAIVAQIGEHRYLVVVNSSMGAVVTGHLQRQGTVRSTVSDRSDTIGKIDIQGPASALVLEKILVDPDRVLGDMIYFSCKGDIEASAAKAVELIDGSSVLLSRTGYTGEFGFELFVPLAATRSVWELLLDAGAEYGITACGLAARDSLRSGAVLPLSHQDIGDWLFRNTPWTFALPWNAEHTAFTKDFVGDRALLDTPAEQFTYAFAGFDPRKIPVTPETAVLDGSGQPIGTVLTCTTDMGIDRVDGQVVSIATPHEKGRPQGFRPRGLSCGFIRVERRCAFGDSVVLSDGKRTVDVEIRRDVRPDRTARRSMREMRTPLAGER